MNRREKTIKKIQRNIKNVAENGDGRTQRRLMNMTKNGDKKFQRYLGSVIEDGHILTQKMLEKGREGDEPERMMLLKYSPQKSGNTNSVRLMDTVRVVEHL